MFAGLEERKSGRIEKLYELLMSKKKAFSLFSFPLTLLFYHRLCSHRVPLLSLSSLFRRQYRSFTNADKQAHTRFQIGAYYPVVPPRWIINRQLVSIQIIHLLILKAA